MLMLKGEMQCNEPKLFEQDELTQAEEDEALMAFNSTTGVSGRWRWKKIGAFAESLHREESAGGGLGRYHAL